MKNNKLLFIFFMTQLYVGSLFANDPSIKNPGVIFKLDQGVVISKADINISKKSGYSEVSPKRLNNSRVSVYKNPKTDKVLGVLKSKENETFSRFFVQVSDSSDNDSAISVVKNSGLAGVSGYTKCNLHKSSKGDVKSSCLTVTPNLCNNLKKKIANFDEMSTPAAVKRMKKNLDSCQKSISAFDGVSDFLYKDQNSWQEYREGENLKAASLVLKKVKLAELEDQDLQTSALLSKTSDVIVNMKGELKAFSSFIKMAEMCNEIEGTYNKKFEPFNYIEESFFKSLGF